VERRERILDLAPALGLLVSEHDRDRLSILETDDRRPCFHPLDHGAKVGA
jgi:hypothetical protein